MTLGTGKERLVFSYCNVPPWALTSAAFNDRPEALELAGVRSSNTRLFSQLDSLGEPDQRGRVFHEYLSVKFALHQWEAFEGNARRSLRNNYVRFLRGWGLESNGVEGAVLKGWVQSRFGIAPTYHRRRLADHPSGEDELFALDRMKGSARTNAIHSQLDLLYEFCQYELQRRFPGEEAFTLYRGTNDPEEHPVLERAEKRRSCVRLNNLCSFTSEREKAWEFGSTVWETRVPLAKIVFFGDLLPDSLLKGESEFLALGGAYWVRELLY
jgi:NAD+--dinitrogen-reductase ADP-D-ribosyltransferase